MTTRVVDSCVVINYLLGSNDHAAAVTFVARSTTLIAPPVFLVEVLGRIAGQRNGGLITAKKASELVRTLVDELPVEIRPFPFDYDAVPRLQELGHNLGLADATYVLLGETTGAPVVTQDSAMILAASKVTEHEVRLP